jgi:ubiquinone/menaquinone biosynthesis C-methylase UbiE
LASRYVTADLAPGADLQLNIEKIDLPASEFDVIVCSHVLEHVRDGAAMAELFRVLKPGGLALIMVPIAEGWLETYEDMSVESPSDREVHFGQSDHVRYYGADFPKRLERAGFDVTTFTASGAATVRHSLFRGEKLFIARRL